MPQYKAPLRDVRFLLNEVFDYEGHYKSLPNGEEATPDMVDAILEGCATFCEEVLAPLNLSGDLEGCTFKDGEVTTPKGFKEAYAEYVAGGWQGLSHPKEYGGQEMPMSLNLLKSEMMGTANWSFTMYPGLSLGCMNTIFQFGNTEQKATYMPPLVSGEWTGTMCLTEPQCGTDLGLVKTKAVPQADGSYKITGTKIFISSGDHDLTENIIHLVLARTPDAPEGVKGISLFIVPKFLINDDGSLGARNDAHCVSIEHKLGIKASPTAVLQFGDHGGAIGTLVGEENRGLEYMFIMMNAARFGVGMQGIAVAERAYQKAVSYAKDRVQSRDLAGSPGPVAIINHPDVRRMLMTMRAYNEGCRALSAWVSRALDAEKHSPEPEVRQRASDFIALMTPVVKALFTDLAFDSANLAVQCYGGHGYIRESGVEQYARDARITMIYEGTNGVQALDLVGRKLGAHMGRYLRSFFHPVSAFIEENNVDGPMKPMIEALAKAFGALQLSTATVAQRALKDPEEAGAASADYLRLMGLVAMGYCFAKATKIAGLQLFFGSEDKRFYDAKIKTATFFFERILPQATASFLAIKAGKKSLMALEDDVF